MATLLQDLRYGIRTLAAVPTIYGAAILSLALGIGANTAIFSVVEGVLLRPLPYPDPDRLVMIMERDLQHPAMSRVAELPPGLLPMSSPNFFDYREQNHVLEAMAGMWLNNATVAAQGREPMKTAGAAVFARFFDILGIHPMLGRTFLAAEEQPGRNRTVVLSYGLWAEAYGKDPGVLGKKFLMDGLEHTVVGVMPPGFEFPKDARFWYPSGFPRDQAPRNFNFLRVVGRIKQGIPLATAQAELSTMARRLERQYPDTLQGRGILLVPLAEQIVGQIRPRLMVLSGVAGLVLLLACGNVANLLLARAVGRRREFAIRTALGARQRRLVRQLLTESLLLVSIGGGLGLLLAFWGLHFMLRLSAGQIPRLESIGVDPAALAFTLAASLTSGIVCGLVPALAAARPDLTAAFKEGGGRAGMGLFGRRLGRLLVGLQLAIAMILVSGAGLLARSYAHLMQVDPGFQLDHVLAVEVTLPAVRYRESHETATFWKELTRRVGALPGVRKAGATFFLPMSGQSATVTVAAHGVDPSLPAASRKVVIQAATPGFFAAMGVPLVRGRLLTDRDDAGAPEVVVVNQAAARHFWPGQDAIDRQLTFAANFGPAGKTESAARQVVGVVGDVRHYGLDQGVEPEIYFPSYQSTWRWANLVLRTTGDPLRLVPAVRSTVRGLDAGLAVGKVRTSRQLLSDSVAKPRFTTLLMLAFASLALLVAGVGVYGAVAYSVGQRTRELAVRMSLGAGHGDIFRLVLGEGIRLGLSGLLAGLAGAMVLARLMTGLLFEVSPLDPATFAVVFLALLALVALASLLPARHAAGVDPMAGLRHE